MTEHDYQIFLDKIKEEDQRLYDLSQKFAELTAEAKKVLDEIKDKSKERQTQHGVEGIDVKNHHKILPREIKEKLLDTAKEVSLS
jgi:Zn-dependent M32 family carboxypeptidase